MTKEDVIKERGVELDPEFGEEAEFSQPISTMHRSNNVLYRVTSIFWRKEQCFGQLRDYCQKNRGLPKTTTGNDTTKEQQRNAGSNKSLW